LSFYLSLQDSDWPAKLPLFTGVFALPRALLPVLPLRVAALFPKGALAFMA